MVYFENQIKINRPLIILVLKVVIRLIKNVCPDFNFNRKNQDDPESRGGHRMSNIPEEDKLHITTQIATALIAEQFPQFSHLPIRPVAHGGNDNRTFRSDAINTYLIIFFDAYLKNKENLLYKETSINCGPGQA